MEENLLNTAQSSIDITSIDAQFIRVRVKFEGGID